MRRVTGALAVEPYTADRELIQAVSAGGHAAVRVARPDRVVVVLGRGSREEDELIQEACAQDGIPVLRRSGGGCAVVLDPGNLVISAAYAVAGIGGHRRQFERLSAWVIRALQRCGLEGIRRADVSDLARGHRKVGGASMYRPRGLLHYTASLLVRPEIMHMERYLRHPPREPAYRRGRRHAEFVTALAPELDGTDLDELAVRLEAELRRDLTAIREESP